MKKLFLVANVFAGLLALFAAFCTLQMASFGVNQMTRAFIAIAIGATCLWMAKQTPIRKTPDMV